MAAAGHGVIPADGPAGAFAVDLVHQGRVVVRRGWKRSGGADETVQDGVDTASGVEDAGKQRRRRRPGDHKWEHEERRQQRPPAPRPVDEPCPGEAEDEFDGHTDTDVDAVCTSAAEAIGSASTLP